MTKFLVFGSKGQLGQSLAKVAPEDVILIEASDVDITSFKDVMNSLVQHMPDIVVNCAAYTAVDKAEEDVNTCVNVNAYGATNIAKACNDLLIQFVHISTDYVFDGNVAGTEDSKTNPLNIYGYSKQLGETLVQTVCPTALIIRTASVYSEFGHNFLKTMLERYNGGQKEFNVVCDHLSCPTYAPDLAETIFKLVKDGVNSKIVHYAGADYISWYDFARKIFLVIDLSVTVNPVSASTYNSKAVRPATSYLKTDPTLNPRSVDSGIVRTLTILLNKE